MCIILFIEWLYLEGALFSGANLGWASLVYVLKVSYSWYFNIFNLFRIMDTLVKVVSWDTRIEHRIANLLSVVLIKMLISGRGIFWFDIFNHYRISAGFELELKKWFRDFKGSTSRLFFILNFFFFENIPYHWERVADFIFDH